MYLSALQKQARVQQQENDLAHYLADELICNHQNGVYNKIIYITPNTRRQYMKSISIFGVMYMELRMTLKNPFMKTFQHAWR